MKTCSRCNTLHDKANCPECVKEKGKIYREKNREKINARQAERYKANPDKYNNQSAEWRLHNAEKTKEINANYRAKNNEKIREKNKERYAANPATSIKYRTENRLKINARMVIYNAANSDKTKERCRKAYLANQEKYAIAGKKWREENKLAKKIHHQNRRAKIKEVGGKLSSGLADRLFILQKGICPCCNLPLGKGFHLDHIMPIALGGTNTDDNMQLLRATCNMQKQARHPVEFMQSRGFLL